jgi:F0F1-type ATP synthase membrane subunit c/vacuolar-type H+-ATPase subunit K
MKINNLQVVLINSFKVLVFAGVMIPIGCAALGTGILFGSYCLAVSRNPDNADALFSQALIFFALIETFVFMSIGVAAFAYFTL